MEVKLTPEAVEDRQELGGGEWETVKSKVDEVSNSLSHEDLKLVSNPLLEHPVWQLAVEETGHRVYLDVKGGSVVIVGIFGFDFAHSGDDHWEELEERV